LKHYLATVQVPTLHQFYLMYLKRTFAVGIYKNLRDCFYRISSCFTITRFKLIVASFSNNGPSSPSFAVKLIGATSFSDSNDKKS